MKSRRSIIRAILFIVRMQRASAHTLRHGYARSCFQRSRFQFRQDLQQQQQQLQPQQQQQRLHLKQQQSGGRLKRCESTCGRLPTRLKYAGKHRNSAPTALIARTPTPQIEIRMLDADECSFNSYSRMMQPYTLRLERSNSSGGSLPHVYAATSGSGSGSVSLMNSAPGSSASLTAAAAAAVRGGSLGGSLGGAGGKAQLTVHTTMAHQLASKLLLRKQPSLDDRASSNVDLFTFELGKLVRHQGSVEGFDKKKLGNTQYGTGTGGRPQTQNANSRLERKVKNSMINLLGALTAVEQDDLESLRVILSKNCFVLNVSLEYGLYSYFSVPLTLLDVALMLGRNAVAELLLRHGATENVDLTCIARRRQVVNSVLGASFNRLRALREKANPTKEDEKRMQLLESQIVTVKKMKSVVELAGEPLVGRPTNVRAFVSAPTRATVEFSAPHNTGSSVVIKYKVEWSRSPSFDSVDGSLEVTDMRKKRITVDNLEHGVTFSFRIAAATIFGYGEFALATPRSLCISSWEDVDQTPNYRVQQMQNIAELYEQVERHRQSTVWQRVFPQNVDTGIKKKKSGIRYLFSASSKFVKNIQRGVYLASLIYTESKVLCTVDDCLPVLCVDEQTSTVSTDDLNWLMKLSLCWDQVPYLLEFASATSVSNASQLRAKLLEAITSMMNALGVRDIGRIHHVPLIFSNGVTFIVSVNLVNENQTVQGLAMRWMRMEKLLRRKSSLCPALDYLNRELFNIINFFESSQIPLDTGLYLCYLRLESSLNVIRVTVPENVPSVLPFSLIRQNPHVSSEEWQWLRQLDDCATSATPPRPTASQYAFHQQLGRAASVLVHDLDMKPDQMQSQRLFRIQVLQLHSDVSFMLVMPRAEDVCHVNPGYGANEETFSENFKGCASIPASVFQMINLFTYQPDFITAYCRLSIFIEHFIMVLQCEQRQCLLENDSKVYSEQLEKLNEFQQRLDSIWRGSRWISKIASVARDRQVNCAIPLPQIIAPPVSAPLAPGAPVSGGIDDSADIGYHSDQSTEKSSSSRTNTTKNFTQSNAQIRARMRASRLRDNGKEAAVPADAATVANEDLESAWKSRSRSGRRHSEKNIRHTSLVSTLSSGRKPLDYNLQASNKSADFAARKKASMACSMQGASNGSALESDRPPLNNGTPPKIANDRRNTISNNAESTLSTRVLSPKTSVYQRQRRPISMYETSPPAATISAPAMPSAKSAATPPSIPSTPLGYVGPALTAVVSDLSGTPSTSIKTSIVRVYVAYECGLENGASVRLKITNETTAREIVALVVEQIAKVVASPSSVRTNGVQSADDFCLVAIVGSSERRLRDSFPLLRLQSPWNTGRLYVRHVNCISAVIECGSEAYV